ncbi:MAG: U32 family peptidase [Myxococcales bacterium]|nr:U32 family peptidase [Myxococcales bacterium]
MKRPEILAPAGDEPALAAALACGADAVYFGLDEGLNARARAKNFPVATLPALVDRIHRSGARAFLTLNTLVFEDELPLLESVLRAAALAGVDAVIVQDPAVALLAVALAPTMHVHASTQMTISSAEAARLAASFGCRRIVLPRELSLAEIARVAAGTDLELEVFVHGALCVSWSGQCLTSEAWGGRSANRGQCAQSCRLPYTLVVDGRPVDTADVRYLLSPLDQAALLALPGLVKLGVASLKIEGRMKGPAYVMTAVQGYRRALDALEAGDALAPAAALARMALSYSRGLGEGFFAGSDHQRLVEGRFPKHRGVCLGRVVEVGRSSVRVERSRRQGSGGIALSGAVATEAGAQVEAAITPIPGLGVGFDTGRPEAEEPGGTLWGVAPAGEGWWLQFPRENTSLARVSVGDLVWITRDPRLDVEADRLCLQGEPEGRLPVDVVVSGTLGQPLRVQMRCRDVQVEATVDALAVASGAGLDTTLLRQKLGTFGGTPFRLRQLDASGLAAGLHVAPAALKACRRALSPLLLDRLLASLRHEVSPEGVTERLVAQAVALQAARPWRPAATPELIPLCRTDAQLDAVLAAGWPNVELDWMEMVGLGRAVARARAAGLTVGIATTRVHKPGEEAIDRRIAALRPDSVLVRHWAGLVHFSERPVAERPVVHGDFSLNVTNSVTGHHLLARGADTLTAAHDLDEAQVMALLIRFPAERLTVVAHHHISTFHTEHCVYAHTLSTGRDYKTCGRPCEAHRVALKDDAGREHPVVVDVGCRNTVFDARAQSAARAVPRLLAAGVRRFRVEFVWESQAEAAGVLAAYSALLAGTMTAGEVLRRVAAHEQFGVTAGTMSTMRAGAHP